MRFFKLSFIPLIAILWFAAACKSNQATQKEEHSSYAVSDVFLKAKRDIYQGNQMAAIEGFNKCLKMNPQHDASYFELARIYEFQNQELAIRYAQKAAAIAPQNRWYKELEMRVYQQQKKYDLAIKVIKALIQLEPTRKEYYYQLANYQINSDDYHAALETYQDIIDKFGYEEGVLNQQKQIYLKQKNFKKAITILEELIEHHPNNKEYYGMIAEIYLNTGDADQAMEYYRKILRIDPADGFVHFALADYYSAKNDKIRSQRELEFGMSSSTLEVDQKMKVLARMMEIAKNDSQYVPIFDTLMHIALRSNPESPKVLAIHADYALQKKETAKAILFFRKILAIDSSKYVIWNQLLLAELEVNDMAALLSESNRAIELFPQQAELYYLNALAYQHIYDWAKVKERMKMGANFVYNKQDKASFMALMAKAEMQLGEVDNAKANYSRALSLDPLNPSILRDYAFSLASHNLDFSTALSYAKQALELKSGDPDYIYVYAYCLFKDGQKQAALDWLEPAIKLFPDHKDLQLLNMEINKNE